MTQQVVATTRNGLVRLMAVEVDAQTHFELFVQDKLQMTTKFTQLARQLAQATLAGVTGRHAEILVGGLGLGLTLRYILEHSAVKSVCVVELESRVVDWNRTHLGNADLLDDSRVEVVVGDFYDYIQGNPRNYHGIALHVDPAPDRARPENRRIYGSKMMQVLQAHLRSGGTLAFRALQQIPSYERILKTYFSELEWVSVSDQNTTGENQTCVVYQARA